MPTLYLPFVNNRYKGLSRNHRLDFLKLARPEIERLFAPCETDKVSESMISFPSVSFSFLCMHAPSHILSFSSLFVAPLRTCCSARPLAGIENTVPFSFFGLVILSLSSVLPSNSPHLIIVSKVGETTAKFRCAAELVAGIVRGSKHWSHNEVQQMWAFVIPTLEAVVARVEHHTVGDFASMLRYCVYDRDPRRFYPLTDLFFRLVSSQHGCILLLPLYIDNKHDCECLSLSLSLCVS